jgi:hypothetical protein
MVPGGLAGGLLVAMLPHLEPWVGVDLNSDGLTAQVHHRVMARLAPEQEV